MNKFYIRNLNDHCKDRDWYGLIGRSDSGAVCVFSADAIRLLVLILICMKQRLCCNLFVLRVLGLGDSVARITNKDLLDIFYTATLNC